jgi:hypothetical protein
MLGPRLRMLRPGKRRPGLSVGRDVTADPAKILERLRSLDISTWSYKFDHPTVLHLGPMAQDFAEAFGLGDDDRVIHPVDECGVALAAVKALADQVEELERRIAHCENCGGG